MPSWIKYRWKLYKARRKLNRTKKQWHKDIDAQRKAGISEATLQVIYHSAHHEESEYEDEIGELETARLISRAERILVEVPKKRHPWEEGESAWYRSQWTGEEILWPSARRALLKEVKKAERETNTEWRHWLAIFIAVLSVLISLAVAILK